MSRRKRVFFTLVMVMLVALFAETSLQIFYRVSVGRWLWEWWAIPIYEADPIRTYRVKANLDYLHQTSEYTARYFTDSLGLRASGSHQPGPALRKPEGTFRILALGPSFAFGWAVNYEDAYMVRLARELKVPGQQVELINLGTPAQPASYQLKWLKEVGHRYQPDLIVQTWYGQMHNIETDDTLPDQQPSVRDGYLYLPEKSGFARWMKKTRTYSAAIFYAWHAYHGFNSSHTGTGDGKELYKNPGPESGTEDEDVRRYQRYVEFVHRAVTNRPPVVFIYVPLAYVVRPADVDRVAHHGFALDPLRTREQAASLAARLRSNQVNMIDPTAALVENDRTTRMYNLYDIHLTAAGNKAVADQARPVIQEILRKNSSAGH